MTEAAEEVRAKLRGWRQSAFLEVAFVAAPAGESGESPVPVVEVVAEVQES